MPITINEHVSMCADVDIELHEIKIECNDDINLKTPDNELFIDVLHDSISVTVDDISVGKVYIKSKYGDILLTEALFLENRQ